MVPRCPLWINDSLDVGDRPPQRPPEAVCRCGSRFRCRQICRPGRRDRGALRHYHHLPRADVFPGTAEIAGAHPAGPGRTSQRDLVADLAETLGKRGARLMLYYHLGAHSDPQWLEACGFALTDTTTFWKNWSAVIGEIGKRYGDKLAGWWFDDGTANYYYRSAPWELLATAAKAGNPKRLICFNPWILPPATEFQDYLAGEGSNDPSVQGWLKVGDHGRISGGLYEGLQASSALVMESNWLHTQRDSEISKSGWTAANLADLLRRSAALENVVMFNLEIYQGGSLSPATVELLRTAHEMTVAPAAGK